MPDPISGFDWQHHLEAALEACRLAGEIHREHFRSPGLTVQLKEDSSPVTRADRLAEEAIREALHQEAPGLGFLGEELGQEGDERDRWIIDPLDGTRNFVAGLPWFATLIGLQLDGEIVLGVVHAPALGEGETWWAALGQGAFAGPGTDFASCCDRRLRVSQVRDLGQAFLVHGGLAHIQRAGMWKPFSDLVARAGRTRGFGDWWGHVLVAEGRCDAMIEGSVALHDVAALKPILEEAGGLFLTRWNTPLEPGFRDPVLSCNRNLADELCRALDF
ncbi:MAG TPA: inositol monophosphatase family protein [Thermoanaerobaculia bacterium]|nr:inositol monophosphatase family protein [Thermoanaerobaculia bacterium]